jgi:hypothetical protein
VLGAEETYFLLAALARSARASRRLNLASSMTPVGLLALFLGNVIFHSDGTRAQSAKEIQGDLSAQCSKTQGAFSRQTRHRKRSQSRDYSMKAEGWLTRISIAGEVASPCNECMALVLSRGDRVGTDCADNGGVAQRGGGRDNRVGDEVIDALSRC